MQAIKLSSRLPAAAKHNVQSSAVGFCFPPTNLTPEWGLRGRAWEYKGERWHKGHCGQLKEGKGGQAGAYHTP